jgi:hypothetical protein
MGVQMNGRETLTAAMNLADKPLHPASVPSDGNSNVRPKSFCLKISNRPLTFTDEISAVKHQRSRTPILGATPQCQRFIQAEIEPFSNGKGNIDPGGVTGQAQG